MSRPEYLLRYGSRIKDKLSQLGFESVEDFTKFQESKKREDQARVLLNVRRSGDKEDVLKVKEMSATTAPTTSKRKAGTKTANMASPSATAPNMKSYGAMPGKSLDSIVQLDKFAALDVPQIEELWTKYHSTKDCLSAVVPAATYDKMMKNGGEFPMVGCFGAEAHCTALNLTLVFPQFLIPLPRDKGFEFFILQFQNNQIHFTSLHAYQTLGPSCRPYLTLTHYPELRDSKGVVLMRGEVDAAVLGKEMGMDEAKLLALYMQAYYVEVRSRRAGRRIHRCCCEANGSRLPPPHSPQNERSSCSRLSTTNRASSITRLVLYSVVGVDLDFG